MPKSNLDYWVPKLEGNVLRDRRTDAALRRAGWTVVRLWEHTSTDHAVEGILETLSEAAAG